MKNKYILLISVIFGLLTGYLIYDYLYKVEQSMNNVQYGQVVVAAQNIGTKVQVTPEMVELKKVPVEYIHPSAVREKEKIMASITKAPVVKGEQILQEKIVPQGDVKNGLSYLVPVGKRAVTVAVDEVSGISGHLKPGDRVDVAAAINIPESGGQREVPYALVVLTDLRVLAVGRILDDLGQGALEYKTVTLAVAVEESRPLILADQKGIIRLMLRSPVDEVMVYTTPFRAEDFMD